MGKGQRHRAKRQAVLQAERDYRARKFENGYQWHLGDYVVGGMIIDDAKSDNARYDLARRDEISTALFSGVL